METGKRKAPQEVSYQSILGFIDLPERFDRSPISHTVRKARDMPSALPVL
jgi:hypothetical protein